MATPPSHPDVPPFPAPETFSVLPPIYLLVARLSLLHPQSQPSSSGVPSTLKLDAAIQPKDLPSHVYPIKAKIKAAKDAITSLPDVERSVEAQEQEIRMLEQRVKALRGRLQTLGTLAGGNAEARDADVAMQDVEAG